MPSQDTCWDLSFASEATLCCYPPFSASSAGLFPRTSAWTASYDWKTHTRTHTQDCCVLMSSNHQLVILPCSYLCCRLPCCRIGGVRWPCDAGVKRVDSRICWDTRERRATRMVDGALGVPQPAVGVVPVERGGCRGALVRAAPGKL